MKYLSALSSARDIFSSDTGERNMKEQYDEYCIPVFGNPLSSMGHGNHYSCDFVNVSCFALP